MNFLKKTPKFVIFSKSSEKNGFSKNFYWNMIFLLSSGKMEFFSQKYDIFSMDGTVLA